MDGEEMSKYPDWVCNECAVEAGAHVQAGQLAKFHKGTCDLCGEEKLVTEPKEFGNPEFAFKPVKLGSEVTTEPMHHDAFVPSEPDIAHIRLSIKKGLIDE
jgi:hypothetical protein